MNDFIERFEMLLSERKERRSDFCRNTQIKESTIRGWIKGQTPNVETALKIAEYFSVSVEYLFTGKGSDLTPEERKLLQDFRTMTEDRKQAVLSVADALKV